MTMSLQELSDRMEIQDVVVAYAYALDRGQLDELDRVFTADAVEERSYLQRTAGLDSRRVKLASGRRHAEPCI
ncbi:MAG: SnoaL-like domain [Nevskia sp.]|nr:SnoaL-like domain [Nevskia sp.]